MRILLVDDVPIILEVLHNMLERPDVQIDKAQSCQEAFRLLEENDYDWVTLDLELPDGSGLDILREIRAKHPHTRTIVISSNVEDPLIRKEVLSLGAESVFGKPSRIEDLVECIYGKDSDL